MHRSFRCYILSCCWKVDFSTVWDFPTFPDFPTETDNFPPHPNPQYTHKVALWNRISKTCDLINCTRINQVPVVHSKGSSCSLLEFYAPHTSSMHPTLAHLKPHQAAYCVVNQPRWVNLAVKSVSSWFPSPGKCRHIHCTFMGTYMQLPHKVFLEEVEEAEKLCSGYIPEIR